MNRLMSISGLLVSAAVVWTAICLGITAVVYHVLPENLMDYIMWGGVSLLLINLACLLWAVKVGQVRWQAMCRYLVHKVDSDLVGPLLFAGAIVLAAILALFAKKEWRREGVVAGKSQ